MTFNQLIGTLIVQFGNRLDLRERFCGELEFIKEFTLEDDPSFTPYFLLEDVENFAFTADVQTYALPTGFIKEYEYGFIFQDDDTTPLIKESKEFNQIFHVENDGTVSTGEKPTHYSIVGSKIYLYPTPSIAGNVRIQYYKKTGRIKGDDTNPWLTDGGDWMLNEVGSVVAQEIQNTELALLFDARAQRSRRRLMGKTEERHSMNMRNLKS